MKFFKDELKKIRAFVFDVDGVLSHQSQNLTPDGELIRTSCTKDGYAIMYAIRKGYIIAVISGGGAPGVRERLEKLGVRPEDIRTTLFAGQRSHYVYGRRHSGL